MRADGSLDRLHDLLERAMALWGRRVPKLHLSSGRPGGTTAHADYIEMVSFPGLDPAPEYTQVEIVYIDPVRDLALLRVVSDAPLPSAQYEVVCGTHEDIQKRIKVLNDPIA